MKLSILSNRIVRSTWAAGLFAVGAAWAAATPAYGQATEDAAAAVQPDAAAQPTAAQADPPKATDAPKAADEPKAAEPKVEFTFLGSSDCQRCHYNGPAAIDRRLGSNTRVTLTESRVWEEHDRHSKAHVVLTGERGKQMAAVLGYDVTNDQRCLSCHSNWQKGHPKPEVFEEGVSCESCHGAASEYGDEHRKKDFWKKTPQEKEETYGLIDVHNPAKRSQQCLSCHVGNTAEGKVVTHDMFAAGHPPLPGIAVESFAERMPPHWQTIGEKTLLSPEDRALITQLLGIKEGELQRSKAVAVSAVATLRESVSLLASQAEEAAQVDGGQWPQLAQFDCYACHHELQSPSWRQAQRTRDFVPWSESASGLIRVRPGRPQPPQWPEALILAAVRHAGESEAESQSLVREYYTKTNALRKVFDTQPFGRPKEIAPEAAQLAAWLDSVMKRLATERVIDAPAVQRFAIALCQSSNELILDYESACQVVNAATVLARDLTANGGSLVGVEAKMKPGVKRVLDELHQMLALPLPPVVTAPADPAERPDPDAKPETKPDHYEQDLANRLKAMMNYNPLEFQAKMKELAKALAE